MRVNRKALLIISFMFFVCHITSQEVLPPPGVIVSHIPCKTGKYIGSPSIAVLPNGDYVVSHDVFGPKTTEYRSGWSYIYKSKDKGITWEKISSIDGQFWSNLFVYKEDLYIMGTNKHHGNLILRKSVDNGATWTIPYDSKTGLIIEGEYHTAPVPMVSHNGRLWRAVEYATGKTSKWGLRYSAMVVSVPLDSDVLDAENWTHSNHLPYDSTYLEGNFGAWLEGNVVVDKNNNIVNILRVDVPKGWEEKVAIVKISNDGKQANFDQNDFYNMQGGAKKFTIRYDEKTDKYWTLINNTPNEFKNFKPASVRNNLSLASSSNLKQWNIEELILSHADQVKHGFQYVDWLFEGDDIIFVSRTAFADNEGGANNNHDANFLTFHRIENFRK